MWAPAVGCSRNTGCQRSSRTADAFDRAMIERPGLRNYYQGGTLCAEAVLKVAAVTLSSSTNESDINLNVLWYQLKHVKSKRS